MKFFACIILALATAAAQQLPVRSYASSLTTCRNSCRWCDLAALSWLTTSKWFPTMLRPVTGSANLETIFYMEGGGLAVTLKKP